MNGWENFCLLESRGCQLPINERQIRPLSALKDSHDKKVLAWSRACQQKQNSPPDYRDVVREVHRLLELRPDKDTDEQYREYRRLLQEARATYSIAHKMIKDGELEPFLLCADQKSRRQQRATAKILESFAQDLGYAFMLFEDAGDSEEED